MGGRDGVHVHRAGGPRPDGRRRPQRDGVVSDMPTAVPNSNPLLTREQLIECVAKGAFASLLWMPLGLYEYLEYLQVNDPERFAKLRLDNLYEQSRSASGRPLHSSGSSSVAPPRTMLHPIYGLIPLPSPAVPASAGNPLRSSTPWPSQDFLYPSSGSSPLGSVGYGNACTSPEAGDTPRGGAAA